MPKRSPPPQKKTEEKKKKVLTKMRIADTHTKIILKDKIAVVTSIHEQPPENPPVSNPALLCPAGMRDNACPSCRGSCKRTQLGFSSLHTVKFTVESKDEKIGWRQKRTQDRKLRLRPKKENKVS